MSTWSTGIAVVPEPPEIEGATYLGCFRDMRYERTLDLAYINNENMTNQVRATEGEHHKLAQVSCPKRSGYAGSSCGFHLPSSFHSRQYFPIIEAHDDVTTAVRSMIN